MIKKWLSSIFRTLNKLKMEMRALLERTKKLILIIIILNSANIVQNLVGLLLQFNFNVQSSPLILGKSRITPSKIFKTLKYYVMIAMKIY
jgi:hypothetical protein